MILSDSICKTYKTVSKRFNRFIRKEPILKSIFEKGQLIIVIWTFDGTVVWFNQNTKLSLGFTEADLNQNIKIDRIISPESVSHIRTQLTSREDVESPYEHECSLLNGEGKLIYIIWHNYLLRDNDSGYIVSMGINMTHYKNTVKQLEAANKGLWHNLAKAQKRQEMVKYSKERYRLVMEGANSGLWDWDILNDTAYVSLWWNNIIGPEKQESKGHYQNWLQKIHPKDVQTVQTTLTDYLNRKIPHYSCEYRIKLKNSKYIWILSKGKASWDTTGRAVRMAGSHTDITEWKKTENRLKRLAYYDPLTGLTLRTVFMDRLKSSIKEAKKNNLKLAVLFLDLDNFKAINDIYGHHVGDRVLKEIAGRLKSCIPSENTICRMGGDEFVILVPSLDKREDIDKIAQSEITAFNQALSISNHKIYCTVSIGVAVYPDNGSNGKVLLKKADIALYKAKESGKHRIQYFTDISEEVSLGSDIKRDLEKAIKNEEFFLCYQPIIDIQTNKVVCLEALIRWRHPRRGVINPAVFIPVAEETKQIIYIGEWVLSHACKQLKEWQNMGCTEQCLSVNISGIQLQHPYFAEVTSKILAETGLSPKYLELEITESILMGSASTVRSNLIDLRKQGVKIAIDDFGTGYNSLKFLQEFAVNCLKIDRTFTANIKNEDVNKVIIDTIISLGHKLNVKTIAEGVENREQYEYLKKKGCNMVQGYYFSKPLLPGEVSELLRGKTQQEEI